MGCQLNHAGRRGNLYSLNIIATNPDLSLYECPEEGKLTSEDEFVNISIISYL